MTDLNSDVMDALLLDRKFLRAPLECLSSSVRQMHKTLDADAVRLTAFIKRQFSTVKSLKQRPEKKLRVSQSTTSPTSLTIISPELSPASILSDDLRQSNGFGQSKNESLDSCFNPSFDSKPPNLLTVSFESLSIPVSQDGSHQSFENVPDKSECIRPPTLSFTALSQSPSITESTTLSTAHREMLSMSRIAALEDLEVRYTDTIQALTKALEFIDKMNIKVSLSRITELKT